MELEITLSCEVAGESDEVEEFVVDFEIDVMWFEDDMVRVESDDV